MQISVKRGAFFALFELHWNSPDIKMGVFVFYSPNIGVFVLIFPLNSWMELIY